LTSRPTLALVILTLIWGLTFPMTKAALEDVTPLQFLALRFCLASAILLPIALWKRREFFSGDWRRVWAWGVGIGALLLLGYALQAIGMKFTTASRSGFFTGLLTIFAPLLAAMIGSSRAGWATWAGIPVAMTGVWLLADPSTGGMNLGDWLTVGCAAVFALQMVALEVGSAKLGGIAAAAGGLWLAQVLVGGAGSLGAALIEGESWNVSRTALIGIAYNGIFGSILAVWLQTRFQPLVPAAHASLVFTLEPVFAAVFAWMILGDLWTARGLAGAALIVAAMGFSSLGMMGRREG